MPQRAQMRFPAVSCPVSYGLSLMDGRQSTSRNGVENGATDAANAHSTTIHSQRSPPIVHRPTLPFIVSQDDSNADMGLSLDPCVSLSSGDNPFVNFVSPYYQDNCEALSQNWLPQLAEEFNSAQIFADERDYETSLGEIVDDNESATHEAPASEVASYVAASNTGSQKRRRDIPLTEEEKKERNREYSKRYRRKQNLKTQEKDIELERAKYLIHLLAARLNSQETELRRLVRRERELEADNRNLCQRVIDLEGFPNQCFFEKETGHGNLDTRGSRWSDNLNTDFEHSSEYPGVVDDFQSPFQS